MTRASDSGNGEMRQIFQAKTRDEWFELLARADIPVGKVLDLDEVFSDPHILRRQMVIEVAHLEIGKVKQLGFSIKLSDTPGEVRTVTHHLGQHTDEVLTDLGYSQAEVDALRRDNVVY